jgi:hypothetical protein
MPGLLRFFSYPFARSAHQAHRVQDDRSRARVSVRAGTALEHQFITDPAFNRDRGPASVFGARLHWEF